MIAMPGLPAAAGHCDLSHAVARSCTVEPHSLPEMYAKDALTKKRVREAEGNIDCSGQLCHLPVGPEGLLAPQPGAQRRQRQHRRPSVRRRSAGLRGAQRSDAWGFERRPSAGA
jgi:hypothetical protein